MQTGYILGLLSLPIFLEGCCPKNHQVKITGISFKLELSFNISADIFKCVFKRKNVFVNGVPALFDYHLKTQLSLGVQPQQHYRAVEGEIFMMPCIQSLNHKQWSRTGEGDEGNHDIPCDTLFTVEAKHSGNYSR